MRVILSFSQSQRDAVETKFHEVKLAFAVSSSFHNGPPSSFQVYLRGHLLGSVLAVVLGSKLDVCFEHGAIVTVPIFVGRVRGLREL